METFNNRLQVFGTSSGKRGKAVPPVSGFVHPRQKYKSLFDGFLQNRPFYRADKMRRPPFHLSKIVFLVSEIVYVSIDCMSNGYTTFAVDKVHKK
jgi:hypothetical protein